MKKDTKTLLLGCGRSREKRIITHLDTRPNFDHTELVRLDSNPDVAPDVLFDLHRRPWPFEDDTFDEIHAYEVLEHLQQQGSARGFFADFYEIWRLLRHGGCLVATVPSRFSPWLWGDPGHTRAILPESLGFLNQTFYNQCTQAVPTAATDYREIWRGDFDVLRSEDDRSTHRFILECVKPIRQTAR